MTHIVMQRHPGNGRLSGMVLFSGTEAECLAHVEVHATILPYATGEYAIGEEEALFAAQAREQCAEFGHQLTNQGGTLYCSACEYEKPEDNRCPDCDDGTVFLKDGVWSCTNCAANSIDPPTVSAAQAYIRAAEDERPRRGEGEVWHPREHGGGDYRWPCGCISAVRGDAAEYRPCDLHYYTDEEQSARDVVRAAQRDPNAPRCVRW